MPRVASLLVAVAFAACGADEGAWRVPDDLRIGRFVDGVEQAPVDAALLRSLTPDHVDAERRAWRVARLFGDGFAGPGAVLEVRSASGPPGRFERPGRSDAGGVLVLGVNRRGSAFVDLVEEGDLAAPIHGRGGSLGRGGEPQRVRDVTRLSLAARTAGEPEGGARVLELSVEVDGEGRVWTEDDLVKVAPLSVPGDSGQGERDAWSLRSLLDALVGPGASATGVGGEGGRTVEIPAAAWTDASKTPVLRLNRRGQLKFHWVGPDLAPLDGGEVRHVTKVVVRTRRPG
jgi:hypothetical protein